MDSHLRAERMLLKKKKRGIIGDFILLPSLLESCQPSGDSVTLDTVFLKTLSQSSICFCQFASRPFTVSF